MSVDEHVEALSRIFEKQERKISSLRSQNSFLTCLMGLHIVLFWLYQWSLLE
jgi:hypothetical protein